MVLSKTEGWVLSEAIYGVEVTLHLFGFLLEQKYASNRIQLT
jgi:hypothetical protein